MEKAGRQKTCLQPASIIQGAKGSLNKTEQKLLLGSPCTWGLCPHSPAERSPAGREGGHISGELQIFLQQMYL